jgi:TonB family protein
MNNRIVLALFVLVSVLFFGSTGAPAQESSEAVRKVVTRVPPQYPSLARSMNLRGTVKMLVMVAPNGSPKSIAAKGGNPVLVQSAEKALRDWRWEPASRVTSEEVDLRFDVR